MTKRHGITISLPESPGSPVCHVKSSNGSASFPAVNFHPPPALLFSNSVYRLEESGNKGNNILSSQFMKRVCFFLEHKNVPSLWLTWDKMEAKLDPLYSEGTSRASEEHRLRLPHKCCRFTTAQSMHSYGVKYLTARIRTL